MIIFIILVTLIFLIINYVHFQKLANFSNFFMLMWCIVSVLSSFGFYGLYVPPTKAYSYILLVMIMFGVSSLFLLRLKLNVNSEKTSFKLNWRKINIITALCMIVLLPFSIKGAAIVMSEGFYRLRLSGFSELLYSTNQKLLLMNIIQPLVLAISTLSLVELVENKKVRLSLVISVFNCFLFILIFGGRWILLEFVLLAGIILYDIYGGSISRLVKNNKLIMLLLSVIVLTIAIITLQRSVGGGDGLLYNIYIYFVGSIHLFGVYINNPVMYYLGSDYLLYGKEFFAGVLEPVFLAAKYIGLDWKSGVETINEVTQQFVFVSPQTFMNNNVTMIYAFLRDFGVWGLFICPFLLGAIYAHMYKLKKIQPNIYRKSVYYFSLSIMPFLLFEWMPARMSIILVPFVLYFLTRKGFRMQKQ